MTHYNQLARAGKDYPKIYAIKWFGADGTANSQYIRDQSAEGAIAMSIFSVMSQQVTSSKYEALNTRYMALTQLPLGSYNAGMYDIAFVIARAILETQSTQGVRITPMISPICYDTYGASGWTRLLANGDRAPLPFDIWGYFLEGQSCVCKVAGTYDTETATTSWDTDVLGYTPSGP